MVDRVTDYEEGKWLTAIKNVSVNEPCFTGHFPDQPILPGVLILEALAQAMGILAFKTHELSNKELFYFAGVDEARFDAIFYRRGSNDAKLKSLERGWYYRFYRCGECKW